MCMYLYVVRSDQKYLVRSRYLSSRKRRNQQRSLTSLCSQSCHGDARNHFLLLLQYQIFNCKTTKHIAWIITNAFKQLLKGCCAIKPFYLMAARYTHYKRRMFIKERDRCKSANGIRINILCGHVQN